MSKTLLPILLATSALLGATVARAADLPPPPPPVDDLRGASYDWTGLYVGAWAGTACVDGELTDNSSAGTPDYEMSGCGGKGGLLAGYNHQFENFVLGVEGDWGMSSNIATNDDPTGDFAFSMNSIATLRGRVGYAFDDTLLYVTGGGAYMNGNIDGIISPVPDNIKGDHWGWTVGGGMEHAITDNFRLRLDYLYTHFTASTYDETCCNIDVDAKGEHEIRVGAVWAFGGW